MKKHSVLSLAIIALLVCTAAEAKYSGGAGEPNNPYQIADANDLLALGANTADYDKFFILTADVNLAGQVFMKAIIGSTAFAGTFDGNGHKITHFTNGGLFGVNHGSIKNLGLENFTVSGSAFVGGLVGYNGYSISNCYSTGTVSGGSNSSYVGGLVGWNGDNGNISNCYSTGAVSGSDSVGGLVGYNGCSNSNISNCYSTGTVSGSAFVGGLVGYNGYSISNCYSTGTVSGGSNSSYVGGLVGYNGYSNSNISNCYSTGAVSGSSDSQGVGGLVGRNGYNISNCYSTGTVSGASNSYNVGGLVGDNGGSISNCYSTGAVSGTYDVGGLVGYNDGSISDCCSTGMVTGTSNVGGLVGYNYNSTGIIVSSFWDTQTSGWMTSAGGEGKTTAEMKKMSTFVEADWDFIEIWGIGENQTYPYLRFEPAGDLNHDKKVNFADLAILALHWLEGTEQ
jgi:hypothetical protein